MAGTQHYDKGVLASKIRGQSYQKASNFLRISIKDRRLQNYDIDYHIIVSSMQFPLRKSDSEDKHYISWGPGAG